MHQQGDLLIDGPQTARRTMVLAHGAGARMDSQFMQRMADGLAAEGLRVVRFEFPYMQARRATGRRSAPDRAPVLLDHWLAVIERCGSPENLVIGGKSLGGRIASMVADEAGVGGLVCLGYPFHPPGKPDRLRVAHLAELSTPALIVQGERDPFGSRAEVSGYELSPAIRVAFLEDGDHSFAPRARSGHTLEGHLTEAIRLVAEFVQGLQGVKS